jgi:hypothetical protein
MFRGGQRRAQRGADAGRLFMPQHFQTGNFVAQAVRPLGCVVNAAVVHQQDLVIAFQPVEVLRPNGYEIFYMGGVVVRQKGHGKRLGRDRRQGGKVRHNLIGNSHQDERPFMAAAG